MCSHPMVFILVPVIPSEIQIVEQQLASLLVAVIHLVVRKCVFLACVMYRKVFSASTG